MSFTPEQKKVLLDIKEREYKYTSAHASYWNDRVFVLAAVHEDARTLKHASSALLNDREIVLTAVQKDGDALEYASSALQSDRDVVLAAVQKQGRALEYASSALQNDREIVLAAVQNNQWALKHASSALRNDREIVLTAGSSGLEYASSALQNDREIVFAAVQKYGGALKYASSVLQNDREIVLAAVRNSLYAFDYVPSIFWNDREIVLAAVKEDGDALEYASSALQNDREIVLAAVRKNGRALEYASSALQNDREIVLAAVREDGYALRYASEELRLEIGANREIMLVAVQKDGDALEYASSALQNDREIVLAAVKNWGDALRYASSALQDDREVVLAAVQKHGHALGYASSALQNDRDFVLEAVQSISDRHHGRDILDHIPRKFHKDREIILMAVKKTEWDHAMRWWRFGRYDDTLVFYDYEILLLIIGGFRGLDDAEEELEKAQKKLVSHRHHRGSRSEYSLTRLIALVKKLRTMKYSHRLLYYQLYEARRYGAVLPMHDDRMSTRSIPLLGCEYTDVATVARGFDQDILPMVAVWNPWMLGYHSLTENAPNPATEERFVRTAVNYWLNMTMQYIEDWEIPITEHLYGLAYPDPRHLTNTTGNALCALIRNEPWVLGTLTLDARITPTEQQVRAGVRSWLQMTMA